MIIEITHDDMYNMLKDKEFLEIYDICKYGKIMQELFVKMDLSHEQYEDLSTSLKNEIDPHLKKEYLLTWEKDD